jgi:hypothetical protein
METALVFSAVVGVIMLAWLLRSLVARDTPPAKAPGPRERFRAWARARGRTIRQQRAGLAALGNQSVVELGALGTRIRVVALGTRDVREVDLPELPEERLDDVVREVESRADLTLGRGASYR